MRLCLLYFVVSLILAVRWSSLPVLLYLSFIKRVLFSPFLRSFLCFVLFHAPRIVRIILFLDLLQSLALCSPSQKKITINLSAFSFFTQLIFPILLWFFFYSSLWLACFIWVIWFVSLKKSQCLWLCVLFLLEVLVVHCSSWNGDKKYALFDSRKAKAIGSELRSFLGQARASK